MDTSGSTAGALDRMKSERHLDREDAAAGRSVPAADDRALGGHAGAVAAGWQPDRAGHEGGARHLARVRRAVRRAHAHAGGGSSPSDRRDDRRRGLRQSPRWRASARCQRAIRGGAPLDLRQQPGRLRSSSASPRGARRAMPARSTTSRKRDANRRRSHQSRFGDPAVRTFAQILDEFRQSYVLRYSAQGVKGNGWHAVVVQVPAQPALTIKARSGYFAR